MSIILPPGAGPAMPSTNLKREVSSVVKANIRQLLVDILHDRIGHAMAVASGKTFWRDTFVRNMGAYWGKSRGDADYFADIVYDCLSRAWIDRYPDVTPAAFLDAVHVPSQKSQKEIEQEVEDAWEVEIGSSEASMNQHYVGSARTRKGRDAFSTFWMREPKRPQ